MGCVVVVALLHEGGEDEPDGVVEHATLPLPQSLIP